MGRRGEYIGEFEQLVLLAVARLEGEGYGVTLRREIERRTGRSASIGAVYATLGRLQAKGMVASSEGESTGKRGGRARRLFELLPAGVEALTVARDMQDRMWDGVDLGAGRPAGPSGTR